MIRLIILALTLSSSYSMAAPNRGPASLPDSVKASYTTWHACLINESTYGARKDVGAPVIMLAAEQRCKHHRKSFETALIPLMLPTEGSLASKQRGAEWQAQDMLNNLYGDMLNKILKERSAFESRPAV